VTKPSRVSAVATMFGTELIVIFDSDALTSSRRTCPPTATHPQPAPGPPGQHRHRPPSEDSPPTTADRTSTPTAHPPSSQRPGHARLDGADRRTPVCRFPASTEMSRRQKPVAMSHRGNKAAETNQAAISHDVAWQRGGKAS
jgi:hypothetical protein